MRFSLIFIIFGFNHVDVSARCTPGAKGGQCVIYVRNVLGGDRSKMPGLCQFHRSCGAYLTWRHWDLGHGKGSEPRPGSILVLDKQSGMNVGHVGVVTSVQAGEDGKYRFWLNDSNYGTNERMQCRVAYSYDKATKMATRSGQRAKRVLGFIYGSANPATPSPAPVATVPTPSGTVTPSGTAVVASPPVPTPRPETNPSRVNPYQNLSISNPASGRNQPSPYTGGYYNQGWYPVQHWGGAQQYQMAQWSYYQWQLQNYYIMMQYTRPSAAQGRTADTARQWATGQIQQNTSWGRANLNSTSQ